MPLTLALILANLKPIASGAKALEHLAAQLAEEIGSADSPGEKARECLMLVAENAEAIFSAMAVGTPNQTPNDVEATASVGASDEREAQKKSPDPEDPDQGGAC